MAFLNLLVERIYKHNCLYLALESGGLSDAKLQELILTLKNRHIHTYDLFNLCNTLEINIELIPIRTDGKKSDVEHYLQSPHIEYDGNTIWAWLKDIIS